MKLSPEEIINVHLLAFTQSILTICEIMSATRKRKWAITIRTQASAPCIIRELCKAQGTCTRVYNYHSV